MRDNAREFVLFIVKGALRSFRAEIFIRRENICTDCFFLCLHILNKLFFFFFPD